jgi:hypothetical protein
MQNVHYMCCIRSNFPRLVYPFTTDRIRAGVLLIDCLIIRPAPVLGLEFFDTIRVSLQLARYLCLMELPGISLAKPRVILLRVQIDDIAKDSHQWEEETENIMSVKVSICS